MGPKAYQQTSNLVIRNSNFEKIYLIIIFLKLNKSSLILSTVDPVYSERVSAAKSVH